MGTVIAVLLVSMDGVRMEDKHCCDLCTHGWGEDGTTSAVLQVSMDGIRMGTG